MPCCHWWRWKQSLPTLGSCEAVCAQSQQAHPTTWQHTHQKAARAFPKEPRQNILSSDDNNPVLDMVQVAVRGERIKEA